MDVFAAISDPVRRSLLEQLARTGSARVVDLTAGRGISRPAVSRHLRILGEAGLVRAADHGRERHYALVPGPLSEVTTWSARLAGAADAARHLLPGDAAATSARPPVVSHQLDALDLEVRRTVRERADRSGAPHTEHPAAQPTAGESA